MLVALLVLTFRASNGGYLRQLWSHGYESIILRWSRNEYCRGSVVVFSNVICDCADSGAIISHNVVHYVFRVSGVSWPNALYEKSLSWQGCLFGIACFVHVLRWIFSYRSNAADCGIFKSFYLFLASFFHGREHG